MAEPEMRFMAAGNLHRLDLHNGDRFVLTVEFDLTEHQAAMIMTNWRNFAGDVPLLVLTPGMSLGVIGREAA